MTVPPLGEQQGLWDIESRPKKMKLEAHNAHTKRCDKGMEHIPETAQDGPAKKKRGFCETSQILILNIPELQIN